MSERVPARVFLEQDGRIARVTLCYPGRLNAMSRRMWRELREVFEQIQRDANLRCVVLAGDDGNFCAGGDISEYPDFRFQESSLREFHENEVWRGLQAMLACDVPLVAQIDGACMGAGLEMASCCDIRVAADSSRFGAPIARLGFPMAPREAALVVREVGLGKVRRMLLEAAIFDADAMKEAGFLHQVLVAGQVQQAAQALASRIAALSPQAARLNKQTLRALTNAPQCPQKAASTVGCEASDEALMSAYAYADSEEHREGIRAFLEKRAPVF